MNAIKLLQNLIFMSCRIFWWHLRHTWPSKKRLRKNYFVPAQLTTFDAPTDSITWIGHATFLLRINGLNLITDPIFGTPAPVIPRLVPPAITPAKLPKIDIVIISHNHRDHLDKKSLLALKHHNPCMLVPFGVGAFVKNLGFTNVHEMNWHEPTTIQQTTITCLPAAHWSGRHPFDVNKSICASWMIEHNNKTIYFAGDTCYAPHFADIKKLFPTITTALMPIAPIKPEEHLCHSHMDDKQVVQAFIDLGAKEFIPMHWGTFQLGLDPIEEPLTRVQNIWNQKQEFLQNKSFSVMKFGETKEI